MEYLHQDLTERIIKCFFEVYNTLGYGFLERVYERALLIELRRSGFEVEYQLPIKVYYKDELVGDYLADILVDKTIVLELKAAESIVAEHETQLINYLRATRYEVGLLLNFGKTPEVRRKIFTNDRKPHGDG